MTQIKKVYGALNLQHWYFRKYYRNFLLLLIMLFFIFTSGQTIGQNTQTDKHQIDVRLEQCLALDSNLTTSGMMNCEIIARDEWENEMNKYYKMLMDTLPIEEQTKLKIAQALWLDYKEKEIEFSTTMYYNMTGTLWKIVAASRTCEIVKARALELKSYFDMLTFD